VRAARAGGAKVACAQGRHLGPLPVNRGEVLRAYGDEVKETMKRVLRAVNSAREDGLLIDVSGMDEFDVGDFGTELADAERLLSLKMDSPTLRRQVYKKLALKYLCDVRQDIKDQIVREIERGTGG